MEVPWLGAGWRNGTVPWGACRAQRRRTRRRV